jgi:hypothetical protein
MIHVIGGDPPVPWPWPYTCESWELLLCILDLNYPSMVYYDPFPPPTYDDSYYRGRSPVPLIVHWWSLGIVAMHPRPQLSVHGILWCFISWGKITLTVYWWILGIVAMHTRIPLPTPPHRMFNIVGGEPPRHTSGLGLVFSPYFHDRTNIWTSTFWIERISNKNRTFCILGLTDLAVCYCVLDWCTYWCSRIWYVAMQSWTVPWR